MKFILKDLLTAYKKAKREVFYQNLHLSIHQFVNYEKELFDNLKKLLERLNKKETEFHRFNENKCYHTIIKGIDYNDSDEEDIVISNPFEKWDLLKSRVKSINFRIIPDLSPEIHIIASLWIEFYGKFLESDLSVNCYGSRIGKHESSINHFKPYVHEYRMWQQNGIDVIRESFKKNKKIIAITSDFNLFYHHINPDFLANLDEMFNTRLNKNITNEGFYLNELLTKIISSWSENIFKTLSPEFKLQFRSSNHVGIPIGLSASKVISNLLLLKFDQTIEQDLNPAYYGRYVDDIFIIINNNSKLSTRNSIWEYISSKLNGLTIDINGIICYEDLYTENSSLELNSNKEKIFILDKCGGEEIVSEIENELTKNSSEWRFIPEAENDFEKLSENIIFSESNQKEGLNSLRKANKISIRRLRFANYLKKLEEIVQTHPESFWKNEIKKLVYFVKTFAITPDVIYDYTQYIPRVLQLVIYTKNYSTYLELSEMLKKSIQSLKNLPNDLIYKNELDLLDTYFKEIIKTSIYSGGNIRKSNNGF